jgi:beta-mannosidase
VRFAAECLAFANVPDAAAIEALLPDAPGDIAVHHPAWKAGVPRDRGSGWDFDDVRDHYLAALRGIDPVGLRSIDHDRYLELSRAVTGEVMAEVFGEWRRSASSCGGGLVLWLRDLAPGAGWGLLDHRGEPKVAFHRLRRALAPVAVWTTDEGLGGIAVHVANDRPDPLSARLRVALYQDSERLVAEASSALTLPGHGAHETNVETLLGRFVDAAWAYRFGPPAHDLVVVSLEQGEQGEQGAPVVLAQSMRFPAGPPTAALPPEQVGLAGRASPAADGTVELALSSRRLAYAVRVHVPGFTPRDDAFDIEPHTSCAVRLQPSTPDAIYAGGALTALNLRGRTPIELAERVA